MKPGKPSRRTITTINEDSVWPKNDLSNPKIYCLELTRNAKYTPKYKIPEKSCECSERSSGSTSSFQVVTWGRGNWNGRTAIKVIFKISYHNLRTSKKGKVMTQIVGGGITICDYFHFLFLLELVHFDHYWLTKTFAMLRKVMETGIFDCSWGLTAKVTTAPLM